MRRAAEGRKRLALAAAVLLAVAACAAVAVSYSSQAAAEPSIESMYHMWLGPNGLPLSPRKQRALLFQFCTTNFVSFVLPLPSPALHYSRFARSPASPPAPIMSRLTWDGVRR